jgi:MazG family protein
MLEFPRATAEFTRLLTIIQKLLSPEGCPWDREQTIDSLRPFVLEETYEVLEAIDRHDHTGLCEELGDFVFEAVFLAQLEAEGGHFTIADSLQSIADKLVRRHPHVFARSPGEPLLDSAAQVRARWDQIKAQENASRSGAPTSMSTSVLSGIGATLPALLRSYQIGLRAASVGFDWERPHDVVLKIQEEVDEVREVVSANAVPDSNRLEEEMGDLLFAIANLTRKLGVDPESALRKANDKFTRRFEAMQRSVEQRGRSIREMTLSELDQEWQATKAASPSLQRTADPLPDISLNPSESAK